MVLGAPTPNQTQWGRVVLNGVPMWYLPGSYTVDEAPRFGEKISTGSLRYADFNPYESAHSQETFTGGYGLRRFADITSRIADLIGASVYYETDNVDCSIGPAILGPQVSAETLTGATSSIVWIGEYSPSGGTYAGVTKLVAVGYAGDGNPAVWVREATGNWTLTALALPGLPDRGMVATYGRKLIIGFGASTQAIVTTDLATSTPLVNTLGTSLYMYAITVDRSAVYIAGGTTTAKTNQVITSADGTTFNDQQPTICSGADNVITSLAPGGGIVECFVGTRRELGMVDNTSIYRTLVPFDSYRNDNARNLRWWAAKGGEEQRGPVILAFPRDHSTWIYEPNSATAGTARDISPWGTLGYRPQTIKGITRAFQGTARWLYYSIRATANNWILKYDQAGGATHPYIHVTDLGFGARCDALCISTLFTNNPLLFGGYGTQIFSVILPLDGDNPLDDTSYQYVRTGSLTIPDIDLGFPDEQKILYTVRVVADNLSPGSKTLEVFYSCDGAAFASLGLVENSPAGTVSFPVGTDCRRVGLKFVFKTDDSTITPILLGYSLRVSINSKLYRLWSFRARLPFSADVQGGEDLFNPISTINDLWLARKDGTIVSFTDRFGATRDVRILHLKEHDNPEDQEPDRVPGTLFDVVLLEVGNAPGNFQYDDALSTYDADLVLYG